jgi:hypothetical protein
VPHPNVALFDVRVGQLPMVPPEPVFLKEQHLGN